MLEDSPFLDETFLQWKYVPLKPWVSNDFFQELNICVKWLVGYKNSVDYSLFSIEKQSFSIKVTGRHILYS
jgi:hypothetical protein